MEYEIHYKSRNNVTAINKYNAGLAHGFGLVFLFFGEILMLMFFRIKDFVSLLCTV